MATKVYLSPSDQIKNITARGHSEKHHCKVIAQHAQKYLKKSGFSVKLGDNSKEKSYVDRVRESNEWGADVHVCIHTNSGGGEGSEVFCHPSSVNNKYVVNIYREIAGLTPTKDRGIKTTTSLYEVTKTKAVCVYIEVDFHDDRDIELWIDRNTENIGKAICNGVLLAEGKNPLKATRYAVQVGNYKLESSAEKLKNKLAKTYDDCKVVEV